MDKQENELNYQGLIEGQYYIKVSQKMELVEFLDFMSQICPNPKAEQTPKMTGGGKTIELTTGFRLGNNDRLLCDVIEPTSLVYEFADEDNVDRQIGVMFFDRDVPYCQPIQVKKRSSEPKRVIVY